MATGKNSKKLTEAEMAELHALLNVGDKKGMRAFFCQRGVHAFKFDEGAMENAWASAVQFLEQHGQDIDAVLRTAGARIDAARSGCLPDFKEFEADEV